MCDNLFFSSVLLVLPPSLPRVRQFIEMVNGTDSEVRCLGGRSPKSQDSYPGSPRPFSSPSHKASSSQPYPAGTAQLCSARPHLEIKTGLKSTQSANTAPFHTQWWNFCFVCHKKMCTSLILGVADLDYVCWWWSLDYLQGPAEPSLCSVIHFFVVVVLGFDNNICNGVTSNKSHSSSPHSHKPCPPGSGSTPPGSDISLNGSHSQQSTTRYDRTQFCCRRWSQNWEALNRFNIRSPSFYVQ